MKLPPDVQKVMKDVGKDYSKTLGELLMKRYEEALRQMVELGAKQSVPVQVSELPKAEREKWVRTMPNLAADWVKTNQAKVLPAKAVLQAYMDGLRKRGVTPLRDWDREL
jgi:TRAP-type C4-dicarboxylate transport system substrate-binding protein